MLRSGVHVSLPPRNERYTRLFMGLEKTDGPDPEGGEHDEPPRAGDRRDEKDAGEEQAKGERYDPGDDPLLALPRANVRDASGCSVHGLQCVARLEEPSS